MIDTGSCTALTKVEMGIPTDLSETLRLPGLGPKQVHALHYDLDIRITAVNPKAALDRFAAYDEIESMSCRESARATAALSNGLRILFRIVEPESLGAALHHHTGSDAHRVAIGTLARRQGVEINDQGIFEGAERVAGEMEESVFRALRLPYIEPELREARGAIEAARNGLLPELVERSDLRGDLHCRTVATDGHGTLEDMVAAARAQGLEYLAITDHSKRLTMDHGLDSRHLLQQMDQIDRLNESLRGFRILKGIEVDILEDGSLDLPDRVLGRLDLVIGSIIPVTSSPAPSRPGES